MDDTRQFVLRLQVSRSDRQVVTGVVVDDENGVEHSFSGWSEMFAVLLGLLPAGDDVPG